MYNISLGVNRVWRSRSTASILWFIVSLLVPRYLLRDNTRPPSPLIVGNCLSAIPISRIFSRVKGMGVCAHIEAFPFSSAHIHIRVATFCVYRPLISVFNHGEYKLPCYNDPAHHRPHARIFHLIFENYDNIHESRRVLPF